MLHVQVEGQVLHYIHITRVGADLPVVQYWYWPSSLVGQVAPISGLSARWRLSLCVAFVLHLHSHSCAYFERVQVCSIADELELDTGRQA